MTAHDVVLESMILTYQNLNIVPWLQVHDSLIWEIPGDPHHPNEKLESEINEILTRPIPELNNHRFRIDVGRGYDWKQIDIGLEDAE